MLWTIPTDIPAQKVGLPFAAVIAIVSLWCWAQSDSVCDQSYLDQEAGRESASFANCSVDTNGILHDAFGCSWCFSHTVPCLFALARGKD